jgi:hypothetical protein
MLEALVGLAIIGMVAISLLAATGSQVRSAAKADVLLTAAALAQDRLVTIELLDNEGCTKPPDSLLAGTFSYPFDEYTWTAELEAVDEEYDLFAVRITVTGRGEVLPLETLLHRPPLVGTLAAGGGMGGLGGGGRMGAGDRAGGRAGGRTGTGGDRTGGGNRGGTGRISPPRGSNTGRPPPGSTGTVRPPPGAPGSGPTRPPGTPPPAGTGVPPSGGATP